jgi:hypothetical protein
MVERNKRRKEAWLAILAAGLAAQPSIYVDQMHFHACHIATY